MNHYGTKCGTNEELSNARSIIEVRTEKWPRKQRIVTFHFVNAWLETMSE
jgi:hypothetical protein